MRKLFLLFAATIVALCAHAQQRLPNVTLKDITGKTVRVDTLSNNAVSIDQAQNINKVKPLVDENGWTYDVLLDPNGELKRALGIQMIPYTLLLDGKGNIVYKHNGYTEGAENELLEKVKACM